MSSKLPPALIRSLIKEFNIEEEDFIGSHEEGSRITSVRLNPFKQAEIYDNAAAVPWCSTGRYLNERPAFTADPLFHAGCYYVQEASSMFLEHMLKNSTDLSANIRVLDLCASPGGKSTLLSSLLNKQSLLISNEIIKTRVPVLSDNLSKWGPANTFVSNNDPKDFKRLEGYFDVVVADAPCSGSGMFRKDNDAINEWSESAVLLCSQRQKRILADAYPSLKENGTLIYSTCSYSKEENENISDWLCETFNLETVQIPIKEQWGIIETVSDLHRCYGYRFYPHKVKGEGFFIACFIKKEATANPKLRRTREQGSQKHDEIIKHWLRSSEELRIFNFQNEYFAIHESHDADLHLLQSTLYLKKSGTRLGKIMNESLVPDHELAVSLINSVDIRKIDMPRDEAIRYLKRDEIRLDDPFRGWALMCYKDHPLGWAKVLDNRTNNYYPKELRITNPNVL